jgi:hypothetical protein
MGTLDRPGRDDSPDRLDELRPVSSEVPSGGAGQNVERSTTEDLAKAIDEYRPPGPEDLDVDFESFDPRHPRGTLLIVGETGSPDNPKRLAYEGTGVNLFDAPPNQPIPDDPSGQEIVEMGSDRKSWAGRLVDGAARPEVLEGANDAAKEYGGRYEALLEGPKPTGTATGTPDRPVADHQQQYGGNDWGMILVGIPAATGILVANVVQFVRTKVEESRQSTGENSDAHH